MIDDIPKEPTGEVFIYGRSGRTYAAIKVSPDVEALKTFASMFRQIQGIGGERHEPVLFFILYQNMTEKDLVRHLKRQRMMETDEICVGVVSENLENIGNSLREYYLIAMYTGFFLESKNDIFYTVLLIAFLKYPM